MRKISLFALLLILLSTIPLQAESRAKPAPSQNGATSEQEVLRDFETILDLWRDGKYDALFERTAGGKDSRELFTRKLVSAPRRPACCWEKMQDAQVALKGERGAIVRARLGFEGSIPGTVFVTKRIRLNKEDGFWTITQSDLFSLADLSKTKTVYKYLPIQGK